MGPKRANGWTGAGLAYFIIGIVVGCIFFATGNRVWTSDSARGDSIVWQNQRRLLQSEIQDGGGRSSRGLLLAVMAVSVEDVGDIADENLLSNWWGLQRNDTSTDLKIVLGYGGRNSQESDLILLAKECSDFPTHGLMLPRDMYCLLEAVHSAYDGGQYQWLLLANADLYVAVEQLERLLHSLNSNAHHYLGKVEFSPLLHGDYCKGQTGVVLSWVTLQQLVSHLRSCGDPQEDGREWDMALGSCLADKLDLTCQRLTQTSRYFIDDSSGVSVGADSLWSRRETFGDMLTLFPVRSLAHMETLHAFSLIREIGYHQERQHALHNALVNSASCHNSSAMCQLAPATNNNNNNDIASLPRCPRQQETSYPPRATTARTEIQDWDTVEGSRIYTTHSPAPSLHLYGERKSELDLASGKAVEVLNFNLSTDSHYKLKTLKSAHVRYRGSVGREFILDLELESKKGGLHYRRVSLVRPHAATIRILEDGSSHVLEKVVDFVVPLSNVNERFSNFIHNYTSACIIPKEACRLNLVIYGDKDIQSITQQMEELKHQHSNFEYRIIQGKGDFSRGPALHEGLLKLQDTDLAFMCDVDMSLGQSFLDRCRRNTVQGKQVYFPEVFKFYNMDYVYWKSRTPVGYSIDVSHGHWGTYGFGMVCIYRSDYFKIGGFDMSIRGWGGEDIKLVDSTIKNKYEVFRAPEPSLSHHFHQKFCDGLSSWQHESCISSRNQVLASRPALANYVYSLEKKCGVRKGPAA